VCMILVILVESKNRMSDFGSIVNMGTANGLW